MSEATERLLERIESFTHTQRVREMIALGQRDDAESRALLAELGRGGFYERYLALYACYGSRDSAHVAQALTDPSRIIRGLAIRLAALLCDDAQIATALDAAPADIREALLWRLRGRGRHAPIIAHLERLRATGDRQWPALLGFAPAEAVRSHAATFQDRADLAAWIALARLHPAIAAEWLRAWAARPEHDTLTLKTYLTRLLPRLAPRAPDETLALLRAVLDRQELAEFTLPSALAARRPQEVANLALAHARLQVRAASLLPHLRPAQITAMVARAPRDLWLLIGQLPQLPHDERLPIFTALRERIVASRGITVALLSALPSAPRAAEARRQLTLTDHIPSHQLTFAALLPWDEAQTTLDPYLHAMEVRTRQAALRALIGTAAFHRMHLPELLARLAERRTEQDLVRSTMLAALLELPQGIWQAAHLPVLGEILRHGLNDLGLSEATQRQMLGLLVKLLPVHPAWATERLREVLRERGWVQPARDLETLTPAIAAQLTDALRPTLDVLLERDQEAALLIFAEGLPAQRAVLAPLRAVLEELLERTRTRDHANRALTLLARAAPSRFAELVPALLLRDRSWITLPAISSYLVRARQDLLDPFLGASLVDGRWVAGRRRFLLPIERAFLCGTARQQTRLTEGALAVLADPTSDARALTDATRLLARLPAASPDALIQLASDPRTLVRTTALFTLARLDTDAGVPALVTALGDARARIAIHAVRPFLLRMSAERALAIVRAIPLERVTVAKEVVRLLGELPWPAAFAELVTLGRRADLHRDVRIALLRTLSTHLDRAESWDLLDQAARSPDSQIALAALAFRSLAEGQGGQRLTPDQRPRVTAVLALLLAYPAEPVREETLTLCARPALRESAHPHVARILELARSSSAREASAAQRALFTIATEEDAPAIQRLITETLLDRRRLHTMIERLEQGERQTAPASQLTIIRAALDALAADPLTIHLRVRVAMKRFAADDLAAYLAGLRGDETLLTAALLGASEMLRQQAYQFDVPLLERLETALATSEDARLRLIALAALQAQVQRNSYLSADQLAHLRHFRADAASLVAATAQFALLEKESDQLDSAEVDPDEWDSEELGSDEWDAEE